MNNGQQYEGLLITTKSQDMAFRSFQTAEFMRASIKTIISKEKVILKLTQAPTFGKMALTMKDSLRRASYLGKESGGLQDSKMQPCTKDSSWITRRMVLVFTYGRTELTMKEISETIRSTAWAV